MLNVADYTGGKELFDGHYLLIRPLSVDGATADVWIALDTNTVSEEEKDNLERVSCVTEEEAGRLGLIVAIKIYRPQNALDIEGEQRFREEYMIVFNCHHTNLVHPTQFAIFKETPYLVLPYCRKGSSELLAGRRLSDDEVWGYVLDVASGLAYLHALDPPIVHQDIKPANILLDDTHHYAITDFGISAQKGGIGYGGDDENSGTLAYMAPERFLEDVEPMPQSDIWAFGATLFEILTGKVPFGEEGGRKQKETGDVVPAMPGVSVSIQRLISDCLSLKPSCRPTASQIVEAAWAKRYPVRSRRKTYVVMAVVCVLIVGALVYCLLPHREPLRQDPPSVEQVYEEAYRLLDCGRADSLRAGLHTMDSLANTGYVPALYQMAFTYGWISKDTASVNRKKLLGIKMDTVYLPIDDRYSNMAVASLEKIIERRDSAYAQINAAASYLLAYYYVMDNRIYKSNKEKGKAYLRNSRYWAAKAGDKDLLLKINNGLDNLQREKIEKTEK